MNFQAILQSLLPILSPLILQEWSTVGLPALQSLAARLPNDDEKAVAAIVINALDQIAKLEIPKI